MKVLTLDNKEIEAIRKMIDKKMVKLHGKLEEKEKDLTEKEIIQFNKKIARLSLLKDKL